MYAHTIASLRVVIYLFPIIATDVTSIIYLRISFMRRYVSGVILSN